MKEIDQIVFDDSLGDCFRACVASVLEFGITDMPNFWEETQEARVFWDKVNVWLEENHSCKCITIEITKGCENFTQNILCIAHGKSPRGNEDHAVVWYNGLLHDPHPLRLGLKNIPTVFTFFVPVEKRVMKGE
jgi:hypothetical protein